MSASVIPLHAPGSRDRRRVARRARLERERRIVDDLNRGVPIAEIATRAGVTEKSLRAEVKEILARRMSIAPEEFAALQVSRLNVALGAAQAAMATGNLEAVSLVVQILRELDRYHDLPETK